MLIIMWVALLTLTPIAAAGGPVRCTTYAEKTLGRLQTLCDDGTRAVSTFNKTLEGWETTITQSPRKLCTGQMNPKTHKVEVRCR